MNDRLQQFFERSRAPRIEVPAAVDRAILEHARWSLKRHRRMPVWAAAAILLLALGVGFYAATPRARLPSAELTIIDAYRLAVMLESGEAPDVAWDLNGDGAIDDADVLDIARRSVALDGEEAG